MKNAAVNNNITASCIAYLPVLEREGLTALACYLIMLAQAGSEVAKTTKQPVHKTGAAKTVSGARFSLRYVSSQYRKEFLNKT